ncbi:MAG TPA: nucleotidyltransferase domain-containing protein [Bryobacteraceae bacterium]|nr:nucleotidyltransferase domain-containing protein [Bryobacteraceae bacterium]
MERLLTQLSDKLQKAFGDRLVSVVLYGSAAGGNHHGRFSDINILCVLSRVTPEELRLSRDIFQWWREHENPAPLLLSEHEMQTSTDCFAIEFHDIQRQHRILFGKDVVTPLVIDDSFYRAQVEHDLRAKLLRLRQKASGLLEDPDLLRRLLADSVSTFCVLFRHALLLHGIDAGMHKRDVIARAREAFGLDPRPFEQLLDLREGRLKPRDLEPASVLSACLEGIGKVIDAVDRLEKGQLENL